MKIYLAGPFFNENEINQNSIAEDILMNKNLDVFVPRKHLIPGGNIMEHSVWAKKVFDMDVQAIKNCDVFVVLYSGLYSDSGTAFECGYAYSLNKPIICVYLDEEISSLMITNSAYTNLIGLKELENYDFENLKRISYKLEQK